MNLQQRINRLIALGKFCREPELLPDFRKGVDEVTAENPWFTYETITYALKAWGKALTTENINNFVSKYPGLKDSEGGKRIGVVMAGNIPMVGLHDMICVVLSGNTFVGKLSSKDTILPKLIKSILILGCDLDKQIIFTSDKLNDIDAIIATGSNNSSKYFNYYFGKYPNIIRGNRSSVAIIDNNTSIEELKKLADDLYMHWGLGCRNVSKLFIHKSITIKEVIKHFEKYSYVTSHNKYANNYDYNKAIFTMNNLPFEDNGFSLFLKNEGFDSPISCIYYEKFDNRKNLENRLLNEKDNLQCIVSNYNIDNISIPFGQSQTPNLWDYADGIDTMEFLLNLN